MKMADIFGIGTMAAGGFNAGVNYAITEANNAEARKRESRARLENYLYGEKSAEMADVRTRALYNDLYSPSAQVQQLKDAGLSPSLFYGDGGGISGQAGAQGTGAAGISPQVFGMSPIDLSQSMLNAASAKKLEAETNKIKSETTNQDLMNDIQELKNSEYATEWTLTNVSISHENGQEYSFYEMARYANSYEDFLENARKAAKFSNRQDILEMLSSEKGQQIMREIYITGAKLDTEIAILTQQEVNADFYKQLTQTLRAHNFIELSAKEAIGALKNSIAVNTLNEEQKNAWNRLIQFIERRFGQTGKDIAIIVCTILNNAMSNWHFHKTTNNSNVNANAQNNIFN